ncbi:WD40 repeat-like protein [Rozella allomycis CSF55]|uniref:WD40 repeat-like protein n=1 Tax=Rozella allomycis (strain CSF55) TaxID=988480 RepID=A0A4P9YKC4_ROZAC|nr:WD40 repeat-like protein [Rozella allomycis CSF55]
MQEKLYSRGRNCITQNNVFLKSGELHQFYDEFIIVCLGFGQVTCFDMSQKKTVYSIPMDAGGSVTCLQAHDGLLAIGDSDGVCYFHDVYSGERIWILRPDFRTLLTKFRANPAQNQNSRPFAFGHPSFVTAITFDTSFAYVGHNCGDLICWSLDSGRCISIYQNHSIPITCIQFDDVLVISGAKDGSIKVYSRKSNICLFDLKHDKAIDVTCIHFDTRRIAVAFHTGHVAVWYFGKLRFPLRVNTVDACRMIKADDRSIRTLQILMPFIKYTDEFLDYVQKTRETFSYFGFCEEKDEITSSKVKYEDIPDVDMEDIDNIKEIVVCGGVDRTVKLYHPIVNDIVFKLRGHTATIVAIECLPKSNADLDELAIMSLAYDGVQISWDVYNGYPLKIDVTAQSSFFAIFNLTSRMAQ